MATKKPSAKHSRRADSRRSRRPRHLRAARRPIDRRRMAPSRAARREQARPEGPTSSEELAAETAGIGIGGTESEAAWDEELPVD